MRETRNHVTQFTHTGYPGWAQATGISRCKFLVKNLMQVSRASFCCEFLVQVSRTSVFGISCVNTLVNQAKVIITITLQ